MTVYVDDMEARFRRMVMCHMTADAMGELHLFAARLGLKMEWFQGDHYDLSKTKRRKAVELGALEISIGQMAGIRWCRERGHVFISPEDARGQMVAGIRADVYRRAKEREQGQ